MLAGGQELERALFYLDVEGIGVDMEEFRYSDRHWFRKQILTNERLALFHLDDKRVQVQQSPLVQGANLDQ